MGVQAARIACLLAALSGLGAAESPGLREALDRYVAIERAGGWPSLPPGPSLKPGARGERVRLLRARLGASGDLERASASDAFDAPLAEAVRRFQRRHGLEADGVVGRATLAELNVPVTLRLQQIRTNLVRRETTPGTLDGRHVLVNIPAHDLEVVEGGRTLLTMRTITGRSYDPTPTMSDEITSIVLNPTWTVPESIAREELLPALRKDPSRLVRERIRVFDGPGDKAKELDPRSIRWSKIEPEELRYTFRQDPGPTNPLGRIKFLFPNRFNVYLHDTPAGYLFDAKDRNLSHGCVRVERPLELARALLGEGSEWTADRLAAAIASGETREIRLPQAWPVHLFYWTAWVSPDGTVQFRKDVYGLDGVRAG